jgi:hypothetical protein
VLIDPPGRVAAEERGLSLAQVRDSRFMHISDGGRTRRGHSLVRLSTTGLLGLPAGAWVELTPGEDGGMHYLLLGSNVGANTIPLDDEPTSPKRLIAAFRAQMEAAASSLKGRTETPAAPVAAAPAKPVAKAPAPAPVRHDPDEQPTEIPLAALDPSVPVPNIAPGAVDAEPPDEQLHARSTTLVRFFRRRLRDSELRVRELEARLRSRDPEPG